MINYLKYADICIISLLLALFYSIISIYLAVSINIVYALTYLLFDMCTTKSIHSVYYLQVVFLSHFINRICISSWYNTISYIILQTVYIMYYKFTINISAFLFAPYFIFVKTCYPSLSGQVKEKYTIIKNDYDEAKKSIIYFAGLFQRPYAEYKDIACDLSDYNHIYITVNFNKDDIYKDALIQILYSLENIDIECVVGFSFGGSLALQFKQLYNKNIRCVLIAPAGFKSLTFTERFITITGKYLYKLYNNDKWYMIKNYPVYQNTNKLSQTDYVIVSTGDNIHNYTPIKNHTNIIILENIAHLKMIRQVIKRRILVELIRDNYKI